MNIQDSVDRSFDGIEAAVSSQGYCYLSEGWTEDKFRDVCGRFGEIFYEADVKLGGERPRNYQLPREIGFHTDHVSAEYAAWLCVVREPVDGAMQFVDLKKASDRLSPAEQEALLRVGVTDNAAWGGGEPIALCARTQQGIRFHYVPWLDMFAADGEAAAALEKFGRYVDEASRTDLIELDLAPGDVVIVDNHRVAHGRRAIAQASKRHLKRYWMRRAGAAGDRA
jgi:hypothetical protein